MRYQASPDRLPTEIHGRGTSSQAVTDPWHLQNIVWEASTSKKWAWLVPSSQSTSVLQTTQTPTHVQLMQPARALYCIGHMFLRNFSDICGTMPTSCHLGPCSTPFGTTLDQFQSHVEQPGTNLRQLGVSLTMFCPRIDFRWKSL